MTIKGWRKTRDNDWAHISARKGEGYDSRGNRYGHKEINIRWTTFGYIALGTGEGSVSRTFKSKSEARRYAIRYMKSHPNG